MAQRFDLTAQLQLQAPTNTRQVVNQIRQQLQGVNVNVDVQANARAVQQVNRSLQNTSKQANNASRSIGTLNKNLSEAARRFGIITLATGTMLSFAQSVKKAVREAVEFERELVKISQVTGKSVQQLSSLTSEITRLSTSLGVSSSKLLETSRVLAQAGFSADETRKALDILAKTTLGSSFDDITKTVEGSIAVLRQFRAEALATGGEIKFLEQTLDAINSVSKSFAVESSDLIAVIQRVGGVFASAGGSVNELIALFTSVRATTRESAETIATGLRTIFTRIQRTDTVNQLEQLGISLRDAQGRFVGAYEAVRRLSLGLSALDPRDYRFSEIVEELGGFRQIGKVIPLIQQFTVAQDALNVAQSASGSVAEDALTAQQSLAVQVQKVKEEFAALIRQFADSSTFRSIASAALQLASALIKIGEALEPVLPLLTSLLALKIGQGLAPGLGALLGFGGRRKYGGGVIRKFASGGFVPGVGNSDSVPAMLQPGEFVIRKSSAQKLGAETLTAMNENRYAAGGIVTGSRHMYGDNKPLGRNALAREFGISADSAQYQRLGERSPRGEEFRRRATSRLQRRKKGEESKQGTVKQVTIGGPFGASFLRGYGTNVNLESRIYDVIRNGNKTGVTALKNAITQSTKLPFEKAVPKGAGITVKATQGTSTFLAPKGGRIFDDEIMNIIPKAFDTAAKKFNGELSVEGPPKPLTSLLSKSAINSIEGQFFEAYVRAITNNVIKDEGKKDAIFDFSSINQEQASKLFGTKKFVIPNEFKNDPNPANIASILAKAAGQVGGIRVQKFATGGSVKKFNAGGVAKVKSAKFSDFREIENFMNSIWGNGIQKLRLSGEKIGAMDSWQFKHPKVGSISLTGQETADLYKYLQLKQKSLLKTSGFKIDPTEAILSYKTDSSNINMGLTNKQLDKETKREISALKKVSTDKLPKKLFSGIGSVRQGLIRNQVGNDLLKAIGKTFSLPGFLSTSSDRSVAKQFGTGMMLEIMTNPMRKGVAADKHTSSDNDSEKEFILPPNSRFKILKSRLNKLNLQQLNLGGLIQKFATGGDVGTDTVPALLTPGEFVINKSSAQSIGYTNLSNMNKTGVAKFAKGGAVGVKQFANGGQATVSGSQLNDVLAGGTIIVQLQGGGGGNDDLSDQQQDQADNLEDSNKKMETFSSKMDKIAGSLQSFVFLGGLAASLGAQFGDLDEATKDAIAETSGFVTAVAGTAGTLLQMTSSLFSNTASNIANSASTVANSIATNSNTVSQTSAAVSASKLATGIGLAVVAVTVISGAFSFFAAKARSQAKSLKEASDKQIKAIQEGTGSIEDFTKSIIQATQKESESQTFDAAKSGALTGGAIGTGVGVGVAIFGAKMGAAIGNAIAPGIGAIIGGILGSVASIVISAIGGSLIGALLGYSSEVEKQADIFKQFGEELEKSADNLGLLTQAQSNFKQSLSDIDIEESLTPEQRVSRRLSAQSSISPINKLAITEANRQLEMLAKEIDKPVSQLTKSDFEGLPLYANIFELATKSLSEATQGLAQDISESRKTLSEAASIELTGDKTFDEVIASGGLVAQALEASEEAIWADAMARKAALQSQLEGNISAAKREQIEQQIIDTDKRLHRQLIDQYHGLEAMNEEARKNKIALEESMAAQEAYRQSLMKIIQFEKALLMAENTLSRFDQSISNIGAIISGGDFDFSRIAPAGIEDISQVYDRAGFNAGIDQLANGLGAGGRRIAEKVKETSAFIARAQQQLIGKKFDNKGEGIDTKQILTDLGLDVTKLTKEQLSTIDAQLREATKVDSIISADDFNEIFAPIMEEGQRGADALKKANDIRNKELKSYQDFLGVLETQRQKEIEARQKVVETQAKGQELMAKARGEELSLAQKEAARTASAQIPLNRFGLQAGDAAGANRVRNQAQARLATIQGEIAAGRGTPALIKEQKDLSAAVNATTNELNRLSDQSEKAADIMAEIEKERQKRQSLKDITEDFVVGGNEQRQQINEAFAGIQQAVASGTLQMQSEDQRRATVQMLDRLKDVQIPGAGGLTGGQVKEQLIMQDAMRLGMDPEVAKAIYGATTKEEQLIQSMDNLAAQQNQAAQMNAAFEAQNTAMLINSEQQLIQALNNLANNIGAALMSSGGQVPRYLSKGGVGSLFRPKGTDTIPAMLTPGEYVLQKKIVDRYGVNAIEALNNGSAEIAYLAGGGSSRLRGRGRRKPSTGVGIFGAGETIMASRDGDNNIGGGRRLSSRGSRPQSGGIGGGGVGRGGAGTVPNLSGPREQVQAEKEGKFAPFPYERKAHTNVVDYNYTKGDGSDFTAAIGSDEARSYDPFAKVKATTSVVQPVDRSQYALPTRQMGTENERRQIQARRIASESIRRRREEKQNRYAQIMARRRGGFNQMMTPNQNIGVGTGSYMANNFGGGQYAGGGGGGMMSIDSGGVQTVFDNFIGNFSGVFDNIVKSFSGLQNSLTQLAQSMSGFTMQHNVTVEGLVSIGGINMESIKQELSTHIGQMVGQEVSRVMNENSKRFKAG